MKRIITLLYIAIVSLSVSAVTVNDVTGTFRGTLNIGSTSYTNQEVYILPGVVSNSIAVVLPDFTYNNSSLGDIVLVDILMDGNGQLTIDNRTLYLRANNVRATLTGSGTLSPASAQLSLTVVSPTYPNGLSVTFSASPVTNKNYTLTNGGFEGSWSNSEPIGWHSFVSASGDYASFVSGNTNQFQQSGDVRPGTSGSNSALLQSKVTLGVKANGNCSNGRINAGSMSATDASGNYSYSDPSSSGYNTPFAGQPDSLVFWAKYVPGGGNVTDASNKARAHAVITTAARYQDPESTDYSNVKIAEATSDYSATSSKGWQRISTPFAYSAVNPASAAYILVTFSTNQTPGGGNSTKNSPDQVYLDDVEIIYNHSLTAATMNGEALAFTNGQAVSEAEFSDSIYQFTVATNGKAARSFVGYDEVTYQVHLYVIADNYAQAKAYSVYTVQMAEPVPPIVDTEYAYEATICANESYSDDLFENLTQADTYVRVIPNTQGGDSTVTLTLHVNPVYAFAETASMMMNETLEWRTNSYSNLAPGTYYDTLTLQTTKGCDSVYTLTLTVEAIGYAEEDTVTVCQNEPFLWHGQTLNTAQAGEFTVYDSLLSIYGMDSVFVLHVHVNPVYHSDTTLTLYSGSMVEWQGKIFADLPNGTYHDTVRWQTQAGCDSVYTLTLRVSDIPVTYGSYEAEICQGESVTFQGVNYAAPFVGDVMADETNQYGGDSIVHLTVRVWPTYEIDEEMTITAGDDASWEGWNLSTMPEGEMTLYASYYTEQDCDSTIVLHLTVLPRPVTTNLPYAEPGAPEPGARKVLLNGQLYIIREEEKYNILGTKIQ